LLLRSEASLPQRKQGKQSQYHKEIATLPVVAHNDRKVQNTLNATRYTNHYLPFGN